MPPRRLATPPTSQADALAALVDRVGALEDQISGLLPASGQWEFVEQGGTLRVRNRTTGATTPSAWTDAAFASGWTSYDGGVLWDRPRWRVEGPDTIRVVGLAKSTGPVAPLVTVMTLPVGARPIKRHLTRQVLSTAPGVFGCRVDVYETGQIVIAAVDPGAGTFPQIVGYVSIEMTFPLT